MTAPDLAAAKDAIRQRVWGRLEREHAVPAGVTGRIPDFDATDAAAERLASLPQWQAARVVKAVPDRPQQPVRARALAEGKLVYMAVPKLADDLPFYLLDPQNLPVSAREAADRRIAAAVGRRVGVGDMPPVDVIVCGSVAVNREGARLGKGAGYSDIEVGMLQDAGLIRADTTIVTTVHPLQVLDEPLPETAHDFRVDLIVTPDEVITCPRRSPPNGILWDELDPKLLTAIPYLAEHQAAYPSSG